MNEKDDKAYLNGHGGIKGLKRIMLLISNWFKPGLAKYIRMNKDLEGEETLTAGAV